MARVKKLRDTFYIIVDIYTLEVVGEREYYPLEEFDKYAVKFPDYESAKNHLNVLSVDCDSSSYKIYKVEEKFTYDFEVMSGL